MLVSLATWRLVTNPHKEEGPNRVYRQWQSNWRRGSPQCYRSNVNVGSIAAAAGSALTISHLRLMIGAIILAAFVPVAFARAGFSPALIPTMQQLTVPQDRLGDQCRLTPSSSQSLGGNRIMYGLWGNLPIETNPWTGVDRRVIASIRVRISGPPIVPDGPPPTARELARIRDRLADGVEEGYAAFYSQPGPQQLVVYGLKFAPDDMPQIFRLSTPSSPRVRVPSQFDIGLIHVFLFGDEGPCSQAIKAYLKSLTD